MKKSKKKRLDLVLKITAASASIATVIAVIITYITLKEIQKQRIQANRPELVIGQEIPFGMLINFSYFNSEILTNKQKREREKAGTLLKTKPDLEIYTYNDKIDTNHIRIKNAFDWSLVDINTFNDFSFKLINIGLGVAKNIELTWHFDTLSYKLHYDSLKNVKYVNGLITYSGKVYYQTEDDSVRMNAYSNDIFFKYILSGADKQNYCEVNLPTDYLKIWSFLNICDINHLKDYAILHYYDDYYGISKEKFYPPLFLDISYYDINDIQYKRKYKIIIDSGLWMSTSKIGGTLLGYDYKMSFLDSKIIFEELIEE